MADIEQRAAALRAEIDQLKDALLSTTDETERYQLHARINACIRESLALIDQRLQAWRAAGSGAQPADSDPPLRERHAGAQGDQYAESETEGP